jgi:hypothetical protein
MRRIILHTILTIPIFISCITDSGDWGSSLSGMVTDSVTGMPIESAMVYAGDTTTGHPVATDSTGSYGWADFGYGPTVVFVKKAGYATSIRTFEKWRSEKKGVDFRLAPD